MSGNESQQASTHATKFKAELWTIVSGANVIQHELWAVVMLDGPEAYYACAFGSRQRMEQLATDCNIRYGEPQYA